MELPVDEVQLLGLIRDYREQLRSDPTSDVFLPLARCYSKLGLDEAGLDAIKRGIEKNPDHVLGLLFLADLLTKAEEFDEAIVFYERALSLDGHNSDALVGLAQLDLRQQHYQRAQVHINQLVSIDPDHEAIEGLNAQLKSFEVEPDESILLPTATMAELYLSQGLKEKAISIYRSLSQHHPDNVLYRDKLTELVQGSDDASAKDVTDKHVAGLEQWLFAIERRRNNV